MSEYTNAAAGFKRFARNTAKGTKRIARIARLNLSIADEKKNINHLYTEIGKLYYEAHKDDPEGFFVQLFQQIDASMETVDSMQTELLNLKAETRPDDTASEADENKADLTVEIEVEPDAPVAEPIEPEAASEDEAVDPSIEVEIEIEPDAPKTEE